ncbi:hypothetical protein BFAG_03530 [Bacteroides fragilis 3_1_12]|uniref:Uncharacterized protein n=1 Tax=Bacteroides fragilis 3_1_12 TaxID=457424 RepID=A0ABN0BPR6_BACFG|nr:hypothetical protein BFAG_03530 [Bacteroides fragilis 3_1_12]
MNVFYSIIAHDIENTYSLIPKFAIIVGPYSILSRHTVPQIYRLIGNHSSEYISNFIHRLSFEYLTDTLSLFRT